jgi:hypothetical protein
MKNLFKSQSGFSLVQGMILSAILAGSALVTTKMMSEQKRVLKSAETRDQIEELHKIIYSNLQDRKNCERTIFQQNQQTQVISGSSVTLSSIYDQNNAVLYEVFSGSSSQVYQNGNVIIKGIALTSYSSTTGLANLEIGYERMAGVSGANGTNKRTKEGFGAKDIKKTILLRVQRDPLVAGKPFVSCYAAVGANADGSSETGNVNLSKDLCLEMNNGIRLNASGVAVDQNGNPTTDKPMWIWDESTSTCIPNAKCPADQVYTGIDSAGRVKCRTLSDWGNFSDMFLPTSGACVTGQTARIQIVSENPVQVRIECTGVGSCSYQAVSWTVGSNNCSATIGFEMAEGSTTTVADPASPAPGGNQQYTCTNGTWVATGTPTCSSVCPSQAVTWTVGSNTCSATTAEGAGGGTVTATDGTAPTTGSQQYSCNSNGTLTATGTGTCNTCLASGAPLGPHPSWLQCMSSANPAAECAAGYNFNWGNLPNSSCCSGQYSIICNTGQIVSGEVCRASADFNWGDNTCRYTTTSAPSCSINTGPNNMPVCRYYNTDYGPASCSMSCR